MAVITRTRDGVTTTETVETLGEFQEQQQIKRIAERGLTKSEKKRAGSSAATIEETSKQIASLPIKEQQKIITQGHFFTDKQGRISASQQAIRTQQAIQSQQPTKTQPRIEEKIPVFVELKASGEVGREVLVQKASGEFVSTGQEIPLEVKERIESGKVSILSTTDIGDSKKTVDDSKDRSLFEKAKAIPGETVEKLKSFGAGTKESVKEKGAVESTKIIGKSAGHTILEFGKSATRGIVKLTQPQYFGEESVEKGTPLTEKLGITIFSKTGKAAKEFVTTDPISDPDVQLVGAVATFGLASAVLPSAVVLGALGGVVAVGEVGRITTMVEGKELETVGAIAGDVALLSIPVVANVKKIPFFSRKTTTSDIALTFEPKVQTIKGSGSQIPAGKRTADIVLKYDTVSTRFGKIKETITTTRIKPGGKITQKTVGKGFMEKITQEPKSKVAVKETFKGGKLVKSETVKGFDQKDLVSLTDVLRTDETRAVSEVFSPSAGRKITQTQEQKTMGTLAKTLDKKKVLKGTVEQDLVVFRTDTQLRAGVQTKAIIVDKSTKITGTKKKTVLKEKTPINIEPERTDLSGVFRMKPGFESIKIFGEPSKKLDPIMRHEIAHALDVKPRTTARGSQELKDLLKLTRKTAKKVSEKDLVSDYLERGYKKAEIPGEARATIAEFFPSELIKPTTKTGRSLKKQFESSEVFFETERRGMLFEKKVVEVPVKTVESKIREIPLKKSTEDVLLKIVDKPKPQESLITESKKPKVEQVFLGEKGVTVQTAQTVKTTDIPLIKTTAKRVERVSGVLRIEDKPSAFSNFFNKFQRSFKSEKDPVFKSVSSELSKRDTIKQFDKKSIQDLAKSEQVVVQEISKKPVKVVEVEKLKSQKSTPLEVPRDVLVSDVKVKDNVIFLEPDSTGEVKYIPVEDINIIGDSKFRPGITIGELKSELKGEQKVIPGLRSDLKIEQVLGTSPKSEIKPESKMDQVLKSKLRSELKSEQVVDQAIKSDVKLDSGLNVRSAFPSVPKSKSGLILPFIGFPSAGGEALFDVEVGKEANVFFFKAEDLTESQVKEFVKKKVLGTAAASFEVSPANILAREKAAGVESFFSKMFTKSKSDPGRFIQAREERISSEGEKFDITLKGIEARRSGKRKKVFGVF